MPLWLRGMAQDHSQATMLDSEHMRTEAEIRERLEATKLELAAMQKQYRDLTDSLTVQYQGIDTDTINLEGAMARLRTFIRALEWVLTTG